MIPSNPAFCVNNSKENFVALIKKRSWKLQIRSQEGDTDKESIKQVWNGYFAGSIEEINESQWSIKGQIKWNWRSEQGTEIVKWVF